MQVSIARQLGLQPTTVGNFFMNARRRLHDKWQNSDYEQLDSAKVTENNNEHSNMAANIMIVDTGSGYTSDLMHQNQHQTPVHDLNFALEAIESIEQPPPPSDNSEATNCVYSLTSL